MSIRAMTAVWDRSGAEGPQLLALLAIADVVNEEDWEGWIGMDRIAAKMRRGMRAAERAVAALVQSGELEIVARDDRRRRVNVYRILVGRAPAPSGSSGSDSGGGETGEAIDPRSDAESNVTPDAHGIEGEIVNVNPSFLTGCSDTGTRQKRRVVPVKNDGLTPSKMTGSYKDNHPVPSGDHPARESARGSVGFGTPETAKSATQLRWAALGEAFALDPSRSPTEMNRLRAVVEAWSEFDLDAVILPALAEGRETLKKAGKSIDPRAVPWRYFDPIVRRRGEENRALSAEKVLTDGLGTDGKARLRQVAAFLRCGSWYGLGPEPDEAEIDAVRSRYRDAGMDDVLEGAA